MSQLSNEILKYIRLLAIHNVNSHSIEWYTELAYRHYSKTYHTPLHIAKQVMNPAEIVRIYMEDEMVDMTPEDILAIKDRLDKKIQPMLSVEDYQDTADDAEMDDDEWVLQQIAQAAAKEKEEAKNPKKKPAAKSSGPSMGDAMTAAQKAVQNLYSQLNKPVPEDEGEIKFPKE